MFDDGIAVIGLGYIGLPTCAALTRQGLRVTGVDVNERTVSGRSVTVATFSALLTCHNARHSW